MHPQSIIKRNAMMYTHKISWLMSRVQRSLFPHLNQCLPKSLALREERLVSILKIVQRELHVPRWQCGKSILTLRGGHITSRKATRWKISQDRRQMSIDGSTFPAFNWI